MFENAELIAYKDIVDGWFRGFQALQIEIIHGSTGTMMGCLRNCFGVYQ